MLNSPIALRFWRLGAASLLLAVLVARPAAAQDRRVVNGLELWPELQAERALQGDNYGWLGVSGPMTTTVSTDLKYVGIRAGYEHFWNNQWSGGGLLQFAAYSSYRSGSGASNLSVDVTPELYVRHWNTLGSFNFRQRLGLEYFIPAGEAESRALTRLRFDLDRLVSVGRLVLRPRIAYEGRAFLRLQRDANEPKERVIDYTMLRAEVGVRLSDHIDFTPWFAHQTAYTFTLPQTDATGKVTILGGRRNFVTPYLGLDVRYTLFRGKEVFERRQLPTQH
ncbi:hypothetical protein [Hymenobacter sp. GOD-10R]|uniref:hypothetical protein n=1 Tax=Hymenobacter sp. GOD-10R TaxID=3093922 RepID=UPI002D784C3B|nr:hypothetical protein [Hymenobacter sp. GOD-10R]WRQ29458.1 hypothetical protein SD425_04190 [Hymenobacter sp. GOD-10R]